MNLLMFLRIVKNFNSPFPFCMFLFRSSRFKKLQFGLLHFVFITYSNMESAFAALAKTRRETEWLKDFLLEIQLTSNSVKSISIFCNS